MLGFLNFLMEETSSAAKRKPISPEISTCGPNPQTKKHGIYLIFTMHINFSYM